MLSNPPHWKRFNCELHMSRPVGSSLEAPVGDDGFGGEEVAEGAEVGEVEDFGDAVVEGAAGGAVYHARETLELGCCQAIEQAG